MTSEEIIEVVQAHEAGETIQFRIKGSGYEWVTKPTPEWNFGDFDYRVMPNNDSKKTQKILKALENNPYKWDSPFWTGWNRAYLKAVKMSK